MSEQPYLWNREDPRDPFVVKLERALAIKRTQVQAVGRRPRRSRRALAASLVASAAAAVAVWMICTRGEESPGRANDAISAPVAVEHRAPVEDVMKNAVAAEPAELEKSAPQEEVIAERAVEDAAVRTR